MKNTMNETQLVIIECVGLGLVDSYPASNWLPLIVGQNGTMEVELMEYAPCSNTLDVIDVKLPSGKIESIYDFQIVGSLNNEY